MNEKNSNFKENNNNGGYQNKFISQDDSVSFNQSNNNLDISQNNLNFQNNNNIAENQNNFNFQSNNNLDISQNNLNFQNNNNIAENQNNFNFQSNNNLDISQNNLNFQNNSNIAENQSNFNFQSNNNLDISQNNLNFQNNNNIAENQNNFNFQSNNNLDISQNNLNFQNNSNIAENQSNFNFQSNNNLDISQNNSNSFYDSKVDNNSEFNKSKKKKYIISIMIIGGVILVSLLVFFIFFSNNDSNIKIFNNGNYISSNKIKNYKIEKDTIWINKALNITYNLPKPLSDSIINGSGAFSYLHGSFFSYDKGYKIYVDKSLEGHTNLETLASDIISEKISDKYIRAYGFGSENYDTFSVNKKEEVKIGSIDTIYFESNEYNGLSLFGKELTLKIIGYSFVYNNQYISVYGELLVDEDDKSENLRQYLQYIIDSIKPYNGESYEELGGNVKNYYDGGYASSLCSNASLDLDGKCVSNNCKESCGNDYFVINFLSPHILNGVLSNFGNCFAVVKELDKNNVYWDGTIDGIFDATQNQKFVYNDFHKDYRPAYYLDFLWMNYDDNTWENKTTIDVIKKEKLKINKTDINKYIIKLSERTFQYYVAVYTLILNDVPYVISYRMSLSAYSNSNYDIPLTDEQREILMKQTEIVADSFIETFRILKNETYNNYINLNTW